MPLKRPKLAPKTKPRPKPRKAKKRVPTKTSELQLEVNTLRNTLESADPMDAFLDWMRFCDMIDQPAIPEVFAAHALQAGIRVTGGENSYYCEGFYQERKYPDPTPTHRAKGYHSTFWRAVCLCHLNLCFVANRKILWPTQPLSPPNG